MKLGNALQIALSVKDIEKTRVFFNLLGFRKTPTFDPQPYPVEMLTDGFTFIGLNEHEFHSPVLKYYTDTFEEVLAHLESIDAIVNTVKDGDTVLAASVFDPSEQHIVVLPREGRDIPEPEHTSITRIGTLEEYAIPVENLQTSLAFWQGIGFHPIPGPQYGGDEPYPWRIVTDGLLIVGLHQTTEYPRAGLTYYHPDQKATIEFLRSEKMEFKAEMTDKNGDVVSVVTETPDGQPVFIFQGVIGGSESKS